MLTFKRIGRIQFLAQTNLVFIATVGLVLLGGRALERPSMALLMGTLATVAIATIAAKRYRDVGASGWWAALFFIPPAFPFLYILSACVPGHPGANRFGSPPPLAGVGAKLLAFLPWIACLVTGMALAGWVITVLGRHPAFVY